MKAQAVLLTAIGIGITLFCLLGVSWLGPMGAFLNLFSALPAAYLTLRFGVRSGVVVVAVVCLILAQLTTTYTLMAYLGLFGVGSLLLPYCLLRRIPWDRAVFYGTVGAAAVTAVMMIGTVVAQNLNMATLVDQMVRSEVDQAMQVYRNAGFNDSQLQDMKAAVEGMAGFISRSFYGLYLAVLFGVQALTMVFLQRFKQSKEQIVGPSFARWRLPAPLIWVLIAGGFLQFVPLAGLSVVGWNLLVVVLPFYFFQGMAVVHHFLQRKKYPSPVKGVIYLLLLIFNPLPVIVTSVGVFDLWIDFRRPRQKQI